MTITSDPTAPLVAVVGATGNQGGSVIHALAESRKPYRIRGFTRDATKPAAQELAKLGVEIFVVSLVVENKDKVYEAFVGADFAFLVTNFWEHVDVDREVAEGKLLIDAAKSASITRVVWSGLPSFNKLSHGKYKNVYHFDGKALITEYGRHSGVPFVDVQAGFYGSNFLGPLGAPKKQANGSYLFAFPAKPETLIPFIDVVRDYGMFVRYVLEMEVFPDGGEYVAHGETITYRDLVSQWSEETGKTIVHVEISPRQFKEGLEDADLPSHVVLDYVEFSLAWNEFGWKSTPIPPILEAQVHTWADFMRDTNWSGVF
ncbi:NmrA domain-containing protein [Favolaschia claudopus]|uniref:NmrA domain-containing protein n=1 Tax=Favolaschia claudopus TaxID=2862362 RepID=A0AAW0ELP6_9AGAR